MVVRRNKRRKKLQVLSEEEEVKKAVETPSSGRSGSGSGPFRQDLAVPAASKKVKAHGACQCCSVGLLMETNVDGVNGFND